MTEPTSMRVSIAGLDLEVAFGDPGLARSFGQRFGRFRSTAEPRVQVSVAAPALEAPEGVPEMPPLVREGGSLVARGSGMAIRIAEDGSRVEVEGWANLFPVETALKLVVARHLLQRDGLLVHGVGVVARDRAALFTGPSGAGKSTLGAFAARGGLQFLSDELVALERAGGAWRATGTPWNQGTPGSAELRLVGLLAHAPTHSLAPVSPSECARVLLVNTVMPDQSPEGRARLFSLATRVLDAVPCARLRFARDTGVAAALREALNA